MSKRVKYVEADPAIPCPTCGKLFLTAQGVGSHRARVHGYRSGDDVASSNGHHPDLVEPVTELVSAPAPVEDTWTAVTDDLLDIVSRVEALATKKSDYDRLRASLRALVEED